MAKVVKRFRPYGSAEIIEQVSEVEIPYEIRTIEAEEYKLHVGLPFNADMIAKDMFDALDEPTTCIKTCSPFGLTAKDLSGTGDSVFAHMDKALELSELDGGFHESDRNDFNIWHMLNSMKNLAKGTDEIEVDAMVMNEKSKQLEEKKVKIANFMGYVDIVSKNKMWRRCVSWLPLATEQGSPRMLFCTTLLCTILDPRWFVNPRRGYYLDISLLYKYFGFGALSDFLENERAANKRGVVAVNSWWWMPSKDIKTDEPQYYFQRLFGRYVAQLQNRYPVQLASHVAVALTTMRFLSFVYLVWLDMLYDDKRFKFDAAKFFSDDPDAAASFKEHYFDNM